MKQMMVAAAALLAATFAFAQDAEIVKVKGRGVGADKVEALKDAYRDAVERAVGLYVDAEQMMKNEELVKDQILTQSNAYIEKFNVTKEATKPNGLVEVQILAEVRKTALTKKISDVMPTMTVDVATASHNAHVQAVTEAKMQDDALALVKNEFKGFDPVRQLMTVSLVSSRPEIEKIKGDADNVRLWYAVDVKVDEAKYYGELVPRWTRLLDQIKTSLPKRISLRREREVEESYVNTLKIKPEAFHSWGYQKDSSVKSFTGNSLLSGGNYGAGDSPLRYSGTALNEQYVGMTFLRGKLFDRERIVGGLNGLHCIRKSGGIPASSVWSRDALWNLGYIMVRDEIGNDESKVGKLGKSIVVLEKHSGGGFSGKEYFIDDDCMAEVFRWQNGYVVRERKYGKAAFQATEYVISLVDDEGNELVDSTFEISNGYVANTCWIASERYLDDNDCRIAWFVTPFVGARAKSFRKWIAVELPKDDVAKIAKVAISLSE